MAQRRKRRSSKNAQCSDLLALWMLRILIPLKGHIDFFSAWGLTNERVANALGVEVDSRYFNDEEESDKLRATLVRLHRAAEEKSKQVKVPEALAANVERLADLVGLAPAECRILEFVVMLNNFSALDDTADSLGVIATAQVIESLAVILALPEDDVRTALSSNSVLAQSGIVTLDRSGPNRISKKLDPLSSRFAESMLVQEDDLVSLLRDMVAPSGKPTLQWRDYEHVGEPLTLLRAYLRKALDTRRQGVNILVYGKPGTGKTQLARLMAQEMACEIFEIASEDQAGDPIDGDHRLRAFRAAQCFFAERGGMLLFDEVEDIFNDGDGFFSQRSTAQKHKAWINRALEMNPVPTLWLSNSVRGLDNAFIRRFDIVLELQVPNRKQRARIVQEACGDMLEKSSVARIAEAEALTPAVITRAAAVVSAIRDELPHGQASSAIERLVGSTLEAQGYPPIRQSQSSRLPDFYDVAWINAGVRLNEVADGLAASRAGRLCLYGPPGTGKTAFGRWLADQLGRPLHVRRASDLLSKYVGGTERNIARAFGDATDDGAVLLLDEVDTFLRDRVHARHNWEVSEVNEMLAQMESFDGILIASTNLMDDLDQAALRRFDLKLKFDYLLAEQAWSLFNKQCEAMSLTQPSPSLRAEISALGNLTPGDFAAVARQHRFRSIRSAEELIASLRDECELKEAGIKRPMGFLA